jgi:hypothetical protein
VVLCSHRLEITTLEELEHYYSDQIYFYQDLLAIERRILMAFCMHYLDTV